VLVPDLSYKALDVQSGTMAVDAAERLYNMTDPDEIQELRESMLKYCELDTKAMVKIYYVLKNNFFLLTKYNKKKTLSMEKKGSKVLRI